MITHCPFCEEAHDIVADYLEQQLECSSCNNLFICQIVATPILGPMYLDIETTAAPSKSYAEISSIVWWCDNKWHSWVNGKDCPEKFIMYWTNTPQLITFNGKTFDEPKIINQFGVNPHPNHIDTLHKSKECGLKGGLKEISETCNFPRPPELDKVDGAVAIKLWKRFLYDDAEADLQNLLYYNAWDVVLTYSLHCHCKEEEPAPIHDTIPFTLNKELLAEVIPKPRKPPSPRRKVGKIQDFWAKRKADPATSFREAEVCFTRDLCRMERDDVEALIESLGGIVKKSATRTLDFLVVGSADDYGRTGKLDKAEENIAKGAHTKIMDEAEFWKMVKKTKKDSPKSLEPDTSKS